MQYQQPSASKTNAISAIEQKATKARRTLLLVESKEKLASMWDEEVLAMHSRFQSARLASLFACRGAINPGE